MATTTSTKFNLPKTTTYDIMPLAFTGKDKRFKDLTDACQFLLTEIYTMNKAFKAPAKLTYDHFVQKLGMSRETISNGLTTLVERGIIRRLGKSRYKFCFNFKQKDYITIDDYLHKQKWNVAGVEKRLARSRIKTLAFLERENRNPKTNGIFQSSQARISVAVNLPRTTAGDSVRELAAAGLIILQKADTHAKEACKRGLTRYTVAPELLAVKQCKPAPPPDELAEVKAIFKQHDKQTARRQGILEKWRDVSERESTKEAFKRNHADLLEELNRDNTYRNIIQRIESYEINLLWCKRNKVKDELPRLELEAASLRQELIGVLKAHNVKPDIFPQEYFGIEI